MPLLFVSHKHSDRQIALALARFIEERSAARIKVHLSSSPDFQGPRFGKALNAQLREALWKTKVLILVYTSPDQDWSYCMWECGMASHPQSPNTTVIVLQCGADVPSPFQDVLRALTLEVRRTLSASSISSSAIPRCSRVPAAR
jgi:hypothetical protein